MDQESHAFVAGIRLLRDCGEKPIVNRGLADRFLSLVPPFKHVHHVTKIGRCFWVIEKIARSRIGTLPNWGHIDVRHPVLL